MGHKSLFSETVCNFEPLRTTCIAMKWEPMDWLKSALLLKNGMGFFFFLYLYMYICISIVFSPCQSTALHKDKPVFISYSGTPDLRLMRIRFGRA